MFPIISLSSVSLSWVQSHVLRPALEDLQHIVPAHLFSLFPTASLPAKEAMILLLHVLPSYTLWLQAPLRLPSIWFIHHSLGDCTCFVAWMPFSLSQGKHLCVYSWNKTTCFRCNMWSERQSWLCSGIFGFPMWGCPGEHSVSEWPLNPRV